jgi:CubicO group peptidase (beta-lactamase class C family)
VEQRAPSVTGGYRAEPPGSWPRTSWSREAPPPGLELEPLFDELFVEGGPLGSTYAAIVVHQGAILAERYQGALPSFTAEPIIVGPSTPLLSWSMAKTMLAILAGTLVTEGRLELDAPAPVPEWSEPGDPRAAITLRDLLEMRDGLDFAEEYDDAGRSDVIEMLFGEGKEDMAHYAASRPLAAAPGTRFNYSSGSSNIVSRIVGSALGGESAMRAALEDRLFGPLSMGSADPAFDAAGTFAASSFVHATAQDYARFGLMLAQGGVADGRRIVSESWIDLLRRAVSFDEDSGYWYSLHCWVVGDELGSFWCSGFEGQMISVCPALELVVVRLGRTPSDETGLLKAWRDRLIARFASFAASSR